MGSNVQTAKGPQDHLAWNSGGLSIKYLYFKQDPERLKNAPPLDIGKSDIRCNHFVIIF